MKVTALSAKEIRERTSKAIVVGSETYTYCFGEDRGACAHCGHVSQFWNCTAVVFVVDFLIPYSYSIFEYKMLFGIVLATSA